MVSNANSSFRVIPLRTLMSLPPAERGLVLRTLPVVAAVRIALWALPLRQVRRLFRMGNCLPFSVPADLPVSRLEWAVRAASRRIPMASCLTQSLALQFILGRAGHSSQIHIGVKKNTAAGIESHAWVECEGRLLLSAPSDVVMYSRVLALEVTPD